MLDFIDPVPKNDNKILIFQIIMMMIIIVMSFVFIRVFRSKTELAA